MSDEAKEDKKVNPDMAQVIVRLGKELNCNKQELIEKALKLLNHCFEGQKKGSKLVLIDADGKNLNDIIITPKGEEDNGL